MPPKRLTRLLRTLREDKGLTQAELARKAKVTQSYVAMLEGGEKRNPSLEILQRLAKALGVPVTRLLE